MDRAEQAAAIHDDGFNCAQSVLAAHAEAVGLDRETALKVASGFGGGIGRTGETCGALSGAIMALGMARSKAIGEADEKARMYAETAALIAAFRDTYGATRCNDLLGYDMSTEEGRKAIKESGASKKCPDIIRTASRLLEEALA